MVIQQKTKRPVQFELLEAAQSSILAWLDRRGGSFVNYAFPSRVDRFEHLSTRQYSRLVEEWISGIGLRKEDYGTHSLRRAKAALIYKQTGNLRAVQILLGHSKTRPLLGIWERRLKTRSPWRRLLRCEALRASRLNTGSPHCHAPIAAAHELEVAVRKQPLIQRR